MEPSHQHHEVRSSPPGAGRSGRGGGAAGGSGTFVTADPSAAAASIKKNEYSQELVGAVLALQDLSRSHGEYKNDGQRKDAAAMQVCNRDEALRQEGIKRQDNQEGKQKEKARNADIAYHGRRRGSRSLSPSNRNEAGGAQRSVAGTSDSLRFVALPGSSMHAGSGMVFESAGSDAATANPSASGAAPAFQSRRDWNATTSRAENDLHRLTQGPRGDGTPATRPRANTKTTGASNKRPATAMPKKTVIRRRLGNGTALKRLYMPLELAAAFMPPLASPFAGKERQGVGGRKGKGGKEGGGGRGGAAAAAAAACAGSNDATSFVSRMTMTFVVVLREPAHLDGDVNGGGDAGYPALNTTTHEVEYERRHFGEQVHHRLTRGWPAVCSVLGARVGDVLEMSRRRNIENAFDEEAGESDGAGEENGSADAAAVAAAADDDDDDDNAAGAEAGTSTKIFVRIVN